MTVCMPIRYLREEVPCRTSLYLWVHFLIIFSAPSGKTMFYVNMFWRYKNGTDLLYGVPSLARVGLCVSLGCKRAWCFCLFVVLLSYRVFGCDTWRFMTPFSVFAPLRSTTVEWLTWKYGKFWGFSTLKDYSINQFTWNAMCKHRPWI